VIPVQVERYRSLVFFQATDAALQRERRTLQAKMPELHRRCCAS
jgi:hypothetical protein